IYTSYAAGRLDATTCGDASRAVGTVAINALPGAPSAGNVIACFDGVAHSGSATAGAGESVVWYDGASGGSVTTAPTGSAVGIYKIGRASSREGVSCEGATGTRATVRVNA